MSTDRAAAVEAVFQSAVALHKESRLDEARRLYERALCLDPQHFRALHLLGVVALQRNEARTAVEWLTKAIALEPTSVAAHVNRGNALHESREFAAAVASYDTALALAPECAEAHLNRGNSLRCLDDLAAALNSYDQAIAVKPAYAEAHLNRGLTLSAMNQHEAAIAAYVCAITIRPDYAEAYYNRGNELRTLRRFDAALASYDQAVALQPGFADAHLNRGVVLMDLRRHAAALGSFDRAIGLVPDHAPAHYNRAGALQHLGQYTAAVASYDTAIRLRPDDARSHADRGRALRELKRLDDAVADYDKALALDSAALDLLAMRRHLKMQLCDWSEFDADLALIDAGARGGGRGAPHPFFVLTTSDSADLQRVAAVNFVREEYPAHPPVQDSPKRHTDGRIHVGYFSADFHEHATAYLMVQLLELHDRSRFRVTAFSFGPESTGPMRRRLRAACDDFIDVRERSDAEVAHHARSHGIDIAVDLKGFTQDNRSAIFARRAAPLQVSFLGYPGTMGAPYIDYLIADHTVVPPAARAHYTENIIRLPHSYQVNDSKRLISESFPTRPELGLPADGFVYCCFNNPYKIVPNTFAGWMRILSRVPGSVLWLLADNPLAVRNLRREAATRGIDPDRLVFADRIDLADHLARHRAADLFLDTLPCNAHTTASDALWAGLPVLTCPGESFAGRVAASLVAAVGLPDLIAPTTQAYEDLAVELAAQPQRLAALRRRLREQRLTAPLFDTARYARDLEAAFTVIHERHRSGLPPMDFAVDEFVPRP